MLFEDRYPDDEEILRLTDRYDDASRASLEARGAEPRGWSGVMAGKFSEPRRTDVGSYYRGQGAKLD